MNRRDFLIVTFFSFATSAIAGHEMDDRDLTNGQTFYAEKCASCHGVNLRRAPVLADT